MPRVARVITDSATIVLCGAVGYLAGLFPSADLASRCAAGDDRVRTLGSGNPGATNAAAVLGRAWGAAVLVADVAKGAGAALVGSKIAGDRGAAAAGIGAVAGHCFPPGRAGGKGVATRYGALGITAPGTTSTELAIAGIVVASTRRTTEAMVVSVVPSLVALVLALWSPRRRGTPSSAVFGTVSGAIVLIRFAQGRRGRPGLDPTGDPGPGAASTSTAPEPH
jgi:glycerol-3-phosphate acyltransferase PlsY